MNAREAAQYLRVAHRTVLEWAKAGKIPAHRLLGTRRCTWCFRADELDGILSSVWNFAMWKQDVSMQVNPIPLVTVKGASKQVRQPRTLTVEQFRLLVSHLRERFNTMALMCVCFGLRISEVLALKWADADWLNGTLRVERGIVQQIVDDVKEELQCAAGDASLGHLRSHTFPAHTPHVA
jgi:excisionase family DNA binding protein